MTDEALNGHDLHQITIDLMRVVGESYPNAGTYFMDKNGNIHPVCSFKRTRVKDAGCVNLFLEDGVITKDFEFKLSVPPQELVDYLNENIKQ